MGGARAAQALLHMAVSSFPRDLIREEALGCPTGNPSPKPRIARPTGGADVEKKAVESCSHRDLYGAGGAAAHHKSVLTARKPPERST